MADLAVVALGLDATGMTSGAAQANRALQSVETEMSKAEKGTSQLAGALSGLGGPLGQAGSQLSGFSGQITSLTESFGVMGAATIGLVAGVASLAAGFAKLAIAGSKIADEMLDIAESTGLSVDQVQLLSAAMVRSGESTQGVERAFRSFESAIVNAVRDPASDAARNLKQLGIDAEAAGRDVQGAFIASLANLKEYRTTTEGAVATNEIFGRGIGSLVRGSGELADILGKTREELEDTGIIASRFATDQAGKLDTSINRLTQSFQTFQVVLSGIDGGAITGIFDDLASALEKVNGFLNRVGPQLRAFLNVPVVGSILGGPLGGFAGVDFSGTPLTGGPKRSLGVQEPPPRAGGGGGARGGGGRAVPVVIEDESIKKMADEERKNAAIRKTGQDILIDSMNDLLRDLNATNRNLPIGNVDALKILSGLPSGSTPGFVTAPATRPRVVGRGEAKDALDAQFAGIFDDFIRITITGRANVKDAFAGVLFGMLDIFAQEFSKSFRESFITPLIHDMTDLLTDAITKIFGGISGKGVTKFFAAVGSAFVGLFAEGGTIPSNHWGIVGERGPEIAYAGSTPMQIAPMNGGGPMSINMNFAISTPTGEVSQRTQDQIADSAARGIERAQRLRGAR